MFLQDSDFEEDKGGGATSNGAAILKKSIGASKSKARVTAKPESKGPGKQTEQEFPLGGMTIADLDAFVKRAGGEEALEQTTTMSLRSFVLDKMIKSKGCSYVDFIAAERSTTAPIATVYVSHGWGDLFIATYRTLKSHFENTPNTVLWIDTFSLNPYERQHTDFNFWTRHMPIAVSTIHRLVLVLSHWRRPGALSRSRCLYEAFCAMDCGALFEIALDRSELLEITRATKQESEAFAARIDRFDVRMSSTNVSYERDVILEAITKRTDGVDWFNQRMKHSLLILRTRYDDTSGLGCVENMNGRRKPDLMLAVLHMLSQQESKEALQSVLVDELLQTLASALGLYEDDDTVTPDALTFLMDEVLGLRRHATVLSDLRLVRAYMCRLSLAEALEQGSRPFRRSRLMILGEGGAGKTSFLRAMTKQPFRPSWESTVGLVVEDFVAEKAALSEAGVRIEECTNWEQTVGEGGEARRTLLQQAAATVGQRGARKSTQERRLALSHANLVQPTEAAALIDVSVQDRPVMRMTSASLDDPELTLVSEPPPPAVQAQAASSAVDFSGETVSNLGSFGFGSSDADAVTFSCWDYGGQRVFQTVQHMFLSRLGVYVIAFDMRKLIVGCPLTASTTTNEAVVHSSIVYLRFWFQQISMLALGAPLFIVGTHLDDVRDRAQHLSVSSLLLGEFASIDCWSFVIQNTSNDLTFFPVDNSSKSDPNVDLLRRLINQAALSDPLGYIDRLIPVSWFKVCDKIKEVERRGSSYLFRDGGSESIMAIAKECGVLTEIDSDSRGILSSMLQLFHQLGVVVYYEEFGLDNFVILNPQWLVDLTVCIIRDFSLHPLKRDLVIKLSKQKWMDFTVKGVLSGSILKILWEEESTNSTFLLSLLKKLYLIVELPQRDASEETFYLVPSIVKGSDAQLARLGSPFNSDQFSGTITLTFTKFLPEGYLPRLIVVLTSTSPGYVPFTMNVDEGDGLVSCEACAPCLFYHKDVFCAGVAVDIYPVVLCQDENTIFIHVCNYASKIDGQLIEKRIRDAISVLSLSSDAAYKNIPTSLAFPPTYASAGGSIVYASAEASISTVKATSARISGASVANLPCNSNTHVMLSYCWENKACAVALGNALREQHHIDVWRDEEGSKCLAPLRGGDLDATMARAVEMSSHVVVCVSRAYQESTNCMKEFRYACNLQDAHRLKVLFVMLDKDFTPHSATRISGSIALNIGDDYYYSLFSMSQVLQISGEIADAVRNGVDVLSEAHPVANTTKAILLPSPLYADVHYDDKQLLDMPINGLLEWLRGPPEIILMDTQQRIAARRIFLEGGYSTVESLIEDFVSGLLTTGTIKKWFTRTGDVSAICRALTREAGNLRAGMAIARSAEESASGVRAGAAKKPQADAQCVCLLS